MSAPRTLGVVGTLVWDRLVGRPGESGPIEEWGGISYALSALAASLPEGWTVRPIIKIGQDMAEEGLAFLGRIPRLDLSSIEVVPDANNRVEIRYQSATRRRERLTGGVPSWSWIELAPKVQRCDALYVNYISGYEMELATARALADGFSGPIYTDLHSLFLGTDPHGHRIPRTLEAWPEWLACSHAVQMNEDELELLGGTGGGTDDPWSKASGALGRRPGLITVTLGGRGAAYATAPGFHPDPARWPAASGRRSGAPRRGTVAEGTEPRIGDPTGCGDVWGATAFARLLAGDGLEDAMAEANRLAGINVEHRGATNLYEPFVQSSTAAGAGASAGRA